VLPTYVPRDRSEWQGMLVNDTFRPPCDRSERCGLARACVKNLCVACRMDSECGAGEACVLDHCLLAANVHCRSRRECSGEEAFCILSGFSSDPRGNGHMTADCLNARGGTAQREDVPLAKGLPAPPPPVDTSELLDSVRRMAKNGDLKAPDVR
jgi:hypothetical protein